MLNRRAKTLSSYAGDTALPGGKIDDADKTVEETAVRPDTHVILLLVPIVTGFALKRREAFEEVLLFTFRCAGCLR